MPRIAENRVAALPVSAEQKDRYARILRAASRLGAQHGYERMQMNDVANEAGVAIATLYRYFPSKNDLFLGLLRSRVNDLVQGPPMAADRAPSEAVCETLIAASRALLARPLLAIGMLQANNAAQLNIGREGSDVTNTFHLVLFKVLELSDPGPHDHRMIRLIEQSWYGVLVSVLNNVITLEEGEEDIRLTCRLLLGPTYDQNRIGAESKESR